MLEKIPWKIYLARQKSLDFKFSSCILLIQTVLKEKEMTMISRKHGIRLGICAALALAIFPAKSSADINLSFSTYNLNSTSASQQIGVYVWSNTGDTALGATLNFEIGDGGTDDGNNATATGHTGPLITAVDMVSSHVGTFNSNGVLSGTTGSVTPLFAGSNKNGGAGGGASANPNNVYNTPSQVWQDGTTIINSVKVGGTTYATRVLLAVVTIDARGYAGKSFAFDMINTYASNSSFTGGNSDSDTVYQSPNNASPAQDPVGTINVAAPVPEPVSLGLVAVLIPGLLIRRRRML